MKKWLFLAGIAAAVGSFGAWWSHLPATVPNSGPAGPVAPSLGSEGFQGIGYVEPVSEVRKLTMRTSGVIKTCCVQVGATIRAGGLLVELENATQKADIELARKNLEMLTAEAAHVTAGVNPFRLKVLERSVDRLREKVRHADGEVLRCERLQGTGGVSKQELALVTTQRNQAREELREQEAELLHQYNHVTWENRAFVTAKVHWAKANLQVAEERLEETRLRAPFDGTVLKVLKREGEGGRDIVSEPVMLFGDTSKMRVRAEIDERFVQHLAVGQSALIYGRNLPRTCRGKVASLEQIMGDKTVFTRSSSERKDLEVLQVLIDMEPGFRCPSGLRVDVTILGPKTESEKPNRDPSR